MFCIILMWEDHEICFDEHKIIETRINEMVAILVPKMLEIAPKNLKSEPTIAIPKLDIICFFGAYAPVNHE